MNGAARPLVRLKETLNLDDLLSDDVANFSSNDSPLQLMSPNVIKNKLLSQHNTSDLEDEPKIKAVANYQDAIQLAEEEEEDTVAHLPALKNKKKADPRRQSTAIFSMLEATTSGNGLLDDSELAIGDEDMELLIPLTKGNATLAAKGINNLWVDPDTDDAMLEETLPEPTLEELHAVASAAATAAPSPRKPLGVRDSVAMFAGFSLACDSSPGIDKIQEDDFLSPRYSEKTEKLEKKATVTAAEEQPTADKEEEIKKELPKVPAPVVPRKPSRLKPPSSSSSFFSHTTTAAAVGKTEKAVGIRRPPAAVAAVQLPKKQPEQAPKPSSIVEKSTTTVQKVEPVVVKNPPPQSTAKTQPQQPRKIAASRLPAVALKSRLPRPAPPPAAAAAPAARVTPVSKPPAPPQTRIAAAVTKPSKVLKPITTPVVAKTPAAVVVKKEATSSSSSSPAEDTPRTAHLRWLEMHPELAFGGGPKIANSPEAEEVRRQLD